MSLRVWFWVAVVAWCACMAALVSGAFDEGPVPCQAIGAGVTGACLAQRRP